MKKQHGSGLVFAVVLLFVILAMVVTLSSVTVLETKMSQKTKSSVGAFYNSESGVEWALNQIAQKAGDDPISTIAGWNGTYVPCPDSIGGESTCKVYFIDKNTNNVITGGDAIVSDIAAVRSVGTQTAGDTTQRAIEAAVAVGGGGCYTAYDNNNNPCSENNCCLAGFTNEGSLGKWGFCSLGTDYGPIFLPPGGAANNTYCWEYGGGGHYSATFFGEGYLCCR